MITAAQAKKIKMHKCMIETSKFYLAAIKRISNCLQRQLKKDSAIVCVTFSFINQNDVKMLNDILQDYVDVGYNGRIDETPEKDSYTFKLYLK